MGATIIPVLGAAPLGAARLIKEPVVELLEPAGIVPARYIDMKQVRGATVTLEMQDGSTATIKAGPLQVWAHAEYYNTTDGKRIEPGGVYTGEDLKLRLQFYREDRHSSPSVFHRAAGLDLEGGVKAV